MLHTMARTKRNIPMQITAHTLVMVKMMIMKIKIRRVAAT